MCEKSILIVSYPDDFHAKYVMDKLSLMGISHKLLNVGEYPSAFESAVLLGESMDPDVSHLFGSDGSHTSRFSGVWWRRPLGAYRSEAKTMQEKYVASEAESFIRSLPNFIHGAKWISDPESTRTAGRKPYQLFVARQIGWRIPSTFVGNSSKAAQIFVERMSAAGKDIIVKPVSNSFVRLNSEKVDVENANKIIYAQRISQDVVMENLERITVCPFILQEEIKKECDIRVTVVGVQTFASEIRIKRIDDGDLIGVDWRHHQHQRMYSRHELPKHVSDLCVAITERLGLSFGCIDLGFSCEEGYTFFEINPQGQWLPSETVVGHDISGTLIDLLLT